MPLPATNRYIGVTTIGGHVARAIDFQARTDAYVVMGKPTQWSDPQDPNISDAAPPIPQPTTTVLAEPVVAKKATLTLVVPDSAGPILAYGQQWRSVTPQQAGDLGCRWVLVTASFDYDEAPISSIDSYLTQAAQLNAVTLTVANAAGYQVGDQIQLGLSGQLTTITAVNTNTNVLTIQNALTTPLDSGTFIADLSLQSVFKYRQIGIVTHALSSGQPGQALIPYSFLTGQMLEYYYNTTPIPREINRRDLVSLVLTF